MDFIEVEDLDLSVDMEVVTTDTKEVIHMVVLVVTVVTVAYMVDSDLGAEHCFFQVIPSTTLLPFKCILFPVAGFLCIIVFPNFNFFSILLILTCVFLAMFQ